MCFLDDSTNASAFGGEDVHGFHGHFGPDEEPLIYAVVKFQKPGAIDIDKMTQTASHEFAELVTNPIGTASANDSHTGWIDPSLDIKNEIADIC